MSGLRIDENFTRTDSSGNVSTFVPDALGSTVGLVGSAGSIATSYTYQPFGATTVGGSANGNSYEFTGRENDGKPIFGSGLPVGEGLRVGGNVGTSWTGLEPVLNLGFLL
jgi:hypothetical protein